MHQLKKFKFLQKKTMRLNLNNPFPF